MTPSRWNRSFNPSKNVVTRRGVFQAGKIPQMVLQRSVFPYLGRADRRVIVGPAIGRDAAVVRLDSNRILVCSTDPITGAVRHVGRHVVHVNANDVAVAGGRPLWFLCTILLPPGSSEALLRGIMREVDLEAKKLAVSVVRGHTEAAAGVEHPIVAGFMIGESNNRRFREAGHAREGDKVIMTKTAGLEGTAILAADHSKLLRRRGIGADVIERARKLGSQISIVPEAFIASRMGGVSAMHDPTEGGLVNGLWELAEASNKGMEVDHDKIPVAPETRMISHALRLDPLRLLASGSLLIAVDPSESRRIIRRLEKKRIAAVEIGTVKGLRHGRVMENERSGPSNLEPVYRDELYRLKSLNR